MVDIKYKDKSALIKYHLDTALFDAYDLKVTDLYPIRKVFFLSTDKGEKILKRVDYTIDQINFLKEALDYINRSFKKTIKFTPASNGDLYVIFKGSCYVLLEVEPGNECDFSNPFHLITSSKGIAQLHKASIGFKSKFEKVRGKLDFITNVKRETNELKFFKTLVNKYEEKTKFDQTVLSEIDYYINQAKESVEFLEKWGYHTLCNDEEKVAICHNDLAYHNILIEKDEAYFIDFDYALIDLRVHDLCNFINKVLKNFAYDMKKAEIIIDSYNEISQLSSEEYAVLYGMLLFPQDFYLLCKDYYTRRKNWDEESYLYKLTRCAS